MTGVAGDRPFERDRGLKAAHGIEKIGLQSRLDVSAALRSCWRAGFLPEHAAKSTEKIAEIVHVELLRRAAGARRLLAPLLVAARLLGVEPSGETGLAELVIKLALFFVAEDVVGNRQIFEFVFGFFVAGIYIGMIFARELAVSLTHVIFRCAAFDAKYFVIILLCHRCLQVNHPALTCKGIQPRRTVLAVILWCVPTETERNS